MKLDGRSQKLSLQFGYRKPFPSPGLLHCRQILYRLSHQGSPTFLVNTFYFVSPSFSVTPTVNTMVSRCV